MPHLGGHYIKLRAEQVVPILQEVDGNVYLASKKLGVDRGSLYRFVKKHPKIQEVINQARESMVDIGESKLKQAVLKGEAWAVCFTLKTLGKSRGYVEQLQHAGPDGEPISIMIIPAKGGGSNG